MKEQLSDAAAHTSKAYAAVRRGRDPDAEVEPSRPLSSPSLFGADMQSASGKHEVKTMSPEVLVMKPILRFLQLLCENHNRDLQVSVPRDIDGGTHFIKKIFVFAVYAQTKCVSFKISTFLHFEQRLFHRVFDRLSRTEKRGGGVD